LTRYPLTIADGTVSARGADVSGSIGREGLVRVSISGAYAIVGSMAKLNGGNGMGHLQANRAAVDGKRRANKAGRTARTFALVRRPIFAAAALLVALASGSASYAQSAAFAGMAGIWSGAGNVTFDDGSTERIRCRASYAVGNGGTGLNQNLTCASDSYKFNLSSNIIAERGTLSGTWNESSRGINGNIEGRGNNGNFEIVASSPGFTANLMVTTRGNKQSVTIKAEGQFRNASITLSRS